MSMEKLNPKVDGATPDIVEQNVEELKRLFPEIVTEGKVDFDALQEVLGDYTDNREERYSFTWNGKSQARRLAQMPSTGTLRPCPEESVNWHATQNLFIEGDNLEVLKLLQKSYHRKIKMIYIDPPYNTGNDFIYPDDFRDGIGNYLKITGQTDEEGKKTSTNAETSGRYHTDWLNMMYPRLKLARNLLSDDGAFFASIDESEVANLRKVCDEVFGEEAFIACIANVNNPKGRSDDKHIARAHEYILLYKKSELKLTGWVPGPHIVKRYNKTDEKGRYREIDLRKTGENDRREDRPNLFYPFLYNSSTGDLYPSQEGEVPDGYIKITPTRTDGTDGNWRWGLESAKQRLESLMPKMMPQREKWTVVVKDYFGPDKREKATTAWSQKFANSERGSEQFLALGFGKEVFPFPKPVGLLRAMLQLTTGGDDIVLDLFAGSCSTAQAVLEENASDGEGRRFVMVQIPEPCAKESDAWKAGFYSIAEIGKERIRRSGAAVQGEIGAKENEATGGLFESDGETSLPDLGFRVLKLSTSNIKAWDAEFEDVEGALLSSVENVKPNRSEADVLYELLLKFGLDLAVPMEQREIAGRTVHIIGAGALIVCLADDISIDVIEGIAALKDELAPETIRVVFKDAGFADDVVKTNAVQILRQAGIEDVKSL